MSTQKKRSYTELINRLSKTLNNTVQILHLTTLNIQIINIPSKK